MWATYEYEKRTVLQNARDTRYELVFNFIPDENNREHCLR